MDIEKKVKQRIERLKRKRELLAKALGFKNSANTDALLGIKSNKLRLSKKIIFIDTDEVPGVLGEPPYRDSTNFLKGTVTENPHNDYAQHFVDTGLRPQNFIQDTSLADRYLEYPKLKELMRLKDDLALQKATPPFSVKADLKIYDLKNLGTLFDVILVQPPLVEYQNMYPEIDKKINLWDWNEIANLDVDSIASNRSFIFLWCGSYEGLEHGRACFRKWGYRRCEDICWVKTNLSKKAIPPQRKEGTIFLHTKEHLLMGIKGTIRRSSDYEFIHSNVDLDVIVTEEPPAGSLTKPEEVFYIIEHFCMSRKRIHLFGDEGDLRPGWVTIGPNLLRTNFDPVAYAAEMTGDNAYIGKSNEIEALRPKSPTQRQQNAPPTV